MEEEFGLLFSFGVYLLHLDWRLVFAGNLVEFHEVSLNGSRVPICAVGRGAMRVKCLAKEQDRINTRLKPSPSQPGVKATLSSQNFINRFIPNKENITDNYSEPTYPVEVFLAQDEEQIWELRELYIPKNTSQNLNELSFSGLW